MILRIALCMSREIYKTAPTTGPRISNIRCCFPATNTRLVWVQQQQHLLLSRLWVRWAVTVIAFQGRAAVTRQQQCLLLHLHQPTLVLVDVAVGFVLQTWCLSYVDTMHARGAHMMHGLHACVGMNKGERDGALQTATATLQWQFGFVVSVTVTIPP